MRAFLLRWALPFIMDFLVIGLKTLVKRSDNTIDDRVAESIAFNKEKITAYLKDKI